MIRLNDEALACALAAAWRIASATTEDLEHRREVLAAVVHGSVAAPG